MLREVERFGDKTPKLLDTDTTGFTTPVLFISKLPGAPLAEKLGVMEESKQRLLLMDMKDLLGKVSTIPVASIGYLHNPLDVSGIVQYIEKCTRSYMNTISDAQILSAQQTAVLGGFLVLLRGSLTEKPVRLSYPDLSSGNIMIENDRFSGLVDWEFVMGFEPLYGFGNLLLELISGTTIQWANPKFVLECFPKVQQREVALLAALRIAELLSYLPTTRLYSNSAKEDRLNRHKHALSELENIIEC